MKIMAPAHIMDLSTTPAQISNQQQQQHAAYSHKKFQGNNLYAHKKFGTRTKPNDIQISAEQISQQQSSNQRVVTSNETSTKANKSQALFRPYALGNDTPRKRKYQELIQEDHQSMVLKRVAVTPPQTLPSSALPLFSDAPSSSSQAQLPAVFATGQHHSLAQYHMQHGFPIIPSYLPMAAPPIKRHYQFNAQTFAVILQKQRAALCMGEILKRQNQMNFYNLMGK